MSLALAQDNGRGRDFGAGGSRVPSKMEEGSVSGGWCHSNQKAEWRIGNTALLHDLSE